MTTLRHTTLEIPAAPIGGLDPLPPVAGLLGPPYQLRTDDLPPEIAEAAAYGAVPNTFPYRTQNGYGRDLHPAALPAVVLENDHLCATFLIGLGGRLWSLYDKASGRELLHRNPAVRPANLALRGAWVSGGVEWNIGTRGHSPQTCDPLFAARVRTDEGTPALRLWEYERIRGLVYQLDVELPADSAVLYVHVRVTNSNSRTVPLYWWTNAAAPQTPGTRVLAPADSAFHTSYAGEIERVQAPGGPAGDWTHPGRTPYAGDWFFDMPELDRPWIVAVEPGAGHGVALVSTGRLRGRKLFCWGTSPGGRRWNDWLGTPADRRGPAQPYVEIQAGLTRTQYEHLPMPAGAEWTWTEGYGAVTGGEEAFAADWETALAAASDAVDRLLTPRALAEARRRADGWTRQVPEEVLQLGSGWAALEERRRAAAGERWPADPAVPFPAESLGTEQHAWLALLASGALPLSADDAAPPLSWVAGPDWEARIERAPEQGGRALHLAVMAHAREDYDRARDWYECALAVAPTAWALRGLGHVRRVQGAPDEAVDHLLAACRLAPDEPRLLVETAETLLAVGRAGECRRLLEGVPGAHRGRLRMLRIRAALDDHAPDEARALLLDPFDIPDIREGDTGFDQVWQRAFPDRPLPEHYDFRMRAPR